MPNTAPLPGRPSHGQRPVTMVEEPGSPAVLTPELRDRLLYYASRAPSPHNVQGWRIESRDLELRVCRDPDRQVLREFDPGGRECDLVMPRRRRLANETARLVELARVKVLLESARRRNGGSP